MVFAFRLRFRVYTLACGVCKGLSEGLGFRVSGFGLIVQGLGFRV
jgi:hypothetical protein